MEPWQQWFTMAVASRNAAEDALSSHHWRSCVSRYYYAAYQAVSSVLIYYGLTPPPDEEAWGHSVTPDLLVEHFTPYVRSKDVKQRYADQLRELYAWRINADYRGKEQLQGSVSNARKYATRLVQLAKDTLPEV